MSEFFEHLLIDVNNHWYTFYNSDYFTIYVSLFFVILLLSYVTYISIVGFLAYRKDYALVIDDAKPILTRQFLKSFVIVWLFTIISSMLIVLIPEIVRLFLISIYG